MNRFDPIEALAKFVEAEQSHIVRLWAKQLRAEVHQLDIPSANNQRVLGELVGSLARLLRTRGEEALQLWPESVRAHGALRYDQNFDAEDLARELKALQKTLLHVYGKRHGQVEPQVAELIAELCGEASAAVQACYARILRTEEVRFKEAALMESILQNVDIGILLVELDGTVSYATPAVGRLMGLPVRALLGVAGSRSLDSCLAQVNARSSDGKPFRGAQMPFASVLAQRRPVPEAWMVLDRHPSGDEVIVEMAAIPVWEEGEGSTLVGVIQTMTDRTETAHKTEELSSAYDELRRLQNRLLERTRRQALEQLARGAAHALNNYLNRLRLGLTLLRKDPSATHVEELDRTVGQIGQLVARLEEMSAEQTPEELSEVDVEWLVHEVLDQARPELQGVGGRVRVEAELAPGLRARVDEAFVRELLVNLIGEATSRMPEGGRLTLSSSLEGEAVALRLSHGGRPYDPQEVTGLFDPLGSGSQSPQLALFLAMGRSTLFRWGGQLSYEGPPEAKRPTFLLKLPQALLREQAEPRQALPPPVRHQAHGRRVLVVDDDVDTARMTAEVLADEGYVVKVAHDAQQALALWEASPFDAALLDALMPGKSGWELARELRELTPEALLAVVTGAEVRGQSRASLALVDAVFRKPVEVAQLDEFLGRGGAQAAPSPPA